MKMDDIPWINFNKMCLLRLDIMDIDNENLERYPILEYKDK